MRAESARSAVSSAGPALGYGVIGSPWDSDSLSLGSSPGTPAILLTERALSGSHSDHRLVGDQRTAPSSSGLGRRPLKAVARVRIPLGLLLGRTVIRAVTPDCRHVGPSSWHSVRRPVLIALRFGACLLSRSCQVCRRTCAECVDVAACSRHWQISCASALYDPVKVAGGRLRLASRRSAGSPGGAARTPPPQRRPQRRPVSVRLLAKRPSAVRRRRRTGHRVPVRLSVAMPC